MTPELVREAVRLKRHEPGEARRFLNDGRPPRALVVVPTVAPPPERLTPLDIRGRIRRVHALLTRGLSRAGVLDPDVIKSRPTTVRQEDIA